MKHGNWVPIDARLAKFLPKDRAYSEVEAAYCLQLNYDKESPVTVAGLASAWGWTRKRTARFLKDSGIEIIYPKGMGSRWGKMTIKEPEGVQVGVQVRDRFGTGSGQVRIINNKYLDDERDRFGTGSGQVRDRLRPTINHTTYPNPENNNIADSVPESANLTIEDKNDQCTTDNMVTSFDMAIDQTKQGTKQYDRRSEGCSEASNGNLGVDGEKINLIEDENGQNLKKGHGSSSGGNTSSRDIQHRPRISTGDVDNKTGSERDIHRHETTTEQQAPAVGGNNETRSQTLLPGIGEQGTQGEGGGNGGSDQDSIRNGNMEHTIPQVHGCSDGGSRGSQESGNGRSYQINDGKIKTEESNYRAKPFTIAEVRQMRPPWWSEEEWEDLIDLRRKKKAAQTKRAYNQLINEFEKSKERGYTADEIMNAMNSGKGWSGFKLEWMKETPRIYQLKKEKPQQKLVECNSCQGSNGCHMKGQGKINCSLYSPNLTEYQDIKEAIA